MQTVPKGAAAGATLRIAQETLLVTPAAVGTRIVPIGFPNEKALSVAIAAILALIPEGDDAQKAAKDAAKKGLVEAVRANEPCISIGIDPATGHPNSQDWALLSAHPDKVDGKRLILGGAYRRLRSGQRGQYWQTVTRTPSALINAAMRAMGYQPTPAPKPVYGNPGGNAWSPAGQQQFAYPGQVPGFAPQGPQGDADGSIEDVSGGDDFGLHT